MKKSIWPALALLAASMVMPAMAQTSRNVPPAGLARTVAECDAQFHEADSNGDGYLDRGETSEARGLIPTRLAGEDEIDRPDFLSACRDGVKQQGQGEEG